jgi:hypothetical protein
MQFLAAHVASVRHLQEGAEHVALATVRAAAAQAIPEICFQGVLAHGGEIGPARRAINARRRLSRIPASRKRQGG